MNKLDQMEVKYGCEIMHLVSIGSRFLSEPQEIQDIRVQYAEILLQLQDLRTYGSWERFLPRDVSIAITHIEEACSRHVKAQYVLFASVSWKKEKR